MTISNEEAERIYNDMRDDKKIDVTEFETEEQLRDYLEQFFVSDKRIDPTTGKEIETNKLANLKKVKDKIIEKFLEEWREKKGYKEAAEERRVRELAERIKSIARLEEMIERGEIDIATAERVRPVLEEIEAGELIEIPKEVTGAEMVGRAPETRRVEIGEVPTIPLPKEEKPRVPEYPPQTFTERERRLIQEINQKVAERTSPQRITGTVQRTVIGVRDAVANVGTRVADAVRNVVDWIRRRLGGR